MIFKYPFLSQMLSKFRKIHTRLSKMILRKWSGKVNRNNVSGNLAVRINKIPWWWTNNESRWLHYQAYTYASGIPALRTSGSPSSCIYLFEPSSLSLSLSSPRASFHSTVQGGAFYSPRPLRSLIETRVYSWRTARTRAWTRVFFEN